MAKPAPAAEVTIQVKKLTELTGRVKTLYEYAQKAVQQKNYDYAIELYRMLLLQEPGCEEARLLLRSSQIEKAKLGVGAFSKAVNNMVGAILVNTKGGMLVGQKKWAEALDLVEMHLANDPYNPMFLDFYAKTAVKMGLMKSAGEALELSLKAQPKNEVLVQQVIQHYQKMNENIKVLKYMQMLAALKPGSMELQNQLKQAAAAATMQRGNWETAGSYRDIMKDKKETSEMEKLEKMGSAHDEQSLNDLIDYVVKQIETTPSASNYKRLADLYKQGHHYDKAIEAYAKSTEKLGSNDPSVDDSVTECYMGQYDDEVAQCKKSAQIDPERTQEMEVAIAAIEVRRKQTLFERYKERCERYPSNANYRFALGELYFAENKYDEALGEFQVSARNPQLRLKATIFLGRCMAAKGLYAFAIEQFEKAKVEYLIMDATKKELLYSLALAYEKCNKKKEALDTLKEIFSVDIGYRDVSQRIETYYKAIQEKQERQDRRDQRDQEEQERQDLEEDRQSRETQKK